MVGQNLERGISFSAGYCTYVDHSLYRSSWNSSRLLPILRCSTEWFSRSQALNRRCLRRKLSSSSFAWAYSSRSDKTSDFRHENGPCSCGLLTLYLNAFVSSSIGVIWENMWRHLQEASKSVVDWTLTVLLLLVVIINLAYHRESAVRSVCIFADYLVPVTNGASHTCHVGT